MEWNGIIDAERLWKTFEDANDETNEDANDDTILLTVESLFENIDNMEPFFYYMMSKRVLVDHLSGFLDKFLYNMRSIKIVTHIIDGWEDFFLRSNYTLSFQDRELLEQYRQRVYDVLTRLVGHFGENSNLPDHYRTRLFDYFFIRYTNESTEN
jgi:hypothetical protein